MTVIFLVGPTCSGKSKLALEMAQRFGAEIVNSDSVQVYRELDIGTAKPTVRELKSIPHHLIDIVSAPQVLTAGDYRKLALAVLSDCKSRGVKCVFVVGGSGFYIQALEKGMFELGKVSELVRSSIVKDFESQGLSILYEELKNADPDFAKKIGSNDRYRIMRAVELWREYKEKPTVLREKFRSEPLPYPYFKIGVNPGKETLHKNIQMRTRRMLEDGLVHEVQGLLDKGYSDWSPLSSVGYKETVKLLNSEITREECAVLIDQNTRRLAKRQMTWFRADPEIQWFDPEEGSNGPIAFIHSKLGT